MTMNEMKISPELLQQYTDKTQMIVPELQSSNMNQNNLTTEQQLELLTQLNQTNNTNLEYNPNDIYDNIQTNNDNIEELSDSISTTNESLISTQTNTEYNKNLYYWNKYKVYLYVFIIIFFILNPSVFTYLNKLINSFLNLINLKKFVFSSNINTNVNNLIKSLLCILLLYFLNYLL